MLIILSRVLPSADGPHGLCSEAIVPGASFGLSVAGDAARGSGLSTQVGQTSSDAVVVAEVFARRIRRDAGNGPDEPCQLARDRGDHDRPQLALRHHLPIALA